MVIHRDYDHKREKKKQEKRIEREDNKKGRMNHEWVDIGTMTRRRNRKRIKKDVVSSMLHLFEC